MKKVLLVAAIVPVLALAACGGGSGGSSSGMAAASGAGGQTVAVKALGNAGRVLVDSNGRALYTNDQEANAMVLCTGGCESFWKPLTINGQKPEGSVPGTLGVVKRPDGTSQVTYNGKPLYSFTQEGPGQVTGDGFHDAFGGQQFTWHVASVSGGGSSSSASSNGGGSTSY